MTGFRITPVKQYNDFACFPACLESCIRDLGGTFSHKEFVQSNLELFHGGEAIEGAADQINLDEICARAGYGISLQQGEVDLDLQKIILFIHCNGNAGDQHMVRLVGFAANGKECVVMDPMQPQSTIYIPTDWIRAVYEVHKTDPVAVQAVVMDEENQNLPCPEPQNP
jgi:hypothetical protein